VWLVLIAPSALLAVETTVIQLAFAFGRSSGIPAALPAVLPFMAAINYTAVFLSVVRGLAAEGLSLVDIGWRRRARTFDLAREVFLGFAAACLILAVNHFVIGPLVGFSAIVRSTPHLPSSLTGWAWLLTATLLPFIEESVYRGYAIHRLRPRLGTIPAVLASSVLFGLLHWSRGLPGIVHGSLLGVLFALLFLARRDLLAASVAHSASNFAIVAGTFR
jgi:membrane protease YdiL (CAAX protease family)